MPRRSCCGQRFSGGASTRPSRGPQPSLADLPLEPIARPDDWCAGGASRGGGSHALHPVIRDRNPNPDHLACRALHAPFLRAADAQGSTHSLVLSSILNSRSSASTFFVSSGRKVTW